MPNERGRGLKFGEDDNARAEGGGLTRQPLGRFEIASEIKGSSEELNGGGAHINSSGVSPSYHGVILVCLQPRQEKIAMRNNLRRRVERGIV